MTRRKRKASDPSDRAATSEERRYAADVRLVCRFVDLQCISLRLVGDLLTVVDRYAANEERAFLVIATLGILWRAIQYINRRIEPHHQAKP